ncbi:hypothetical protein GCM10009635_46270 [Actinocatenispora thailandica]
MRAGQRAQVAPERAVAAFDSASAFLRATARALRGEDFVRLGQGRLAGAGARLTALLPERVSRPVYTASGASEGVPADRLGGVDTEAIAEWAVRHYPGTGYPVAFLGSSNGALTHLCAALGAPWLPQTTLVPVRWRDNDPDRPDRAREFGARVAPPLLERNPDVALHHMHDANQDRLMIARMAYFRLKWLRLPLAYRRFLTERLAPGAPIVLVEDGSAWPVGRVAERHVFQTGARGGLGPEDYLHGSSRMARFQQEQGSSRPAPVAPPADEWAAEAEWGFAPELRDDLASFAARHARPLYRLRLDEPEALSPVVAELERRRRGTDRLLVESFIMLDPVQAGRTGSAPFWTVFAVEHSAAALERYLDATEPYRDIDVLLFNHGVRSAGMAGVDRWSALARRARHRGRLLAVDPDRFPADFASLARFVPLLRREPAGRQPHAGITLTDIADEAARWPGVRLTPNDGR